MRRYNFDRADWFLLGVAVALIIACILMVFIPREEKKTVPCNSGVYTLRDGNKVEMVYLEAEDTCKERK